MKRRNFLKGLLAVPVAASIPVALAKQETVLEQGQRIARKKLNPNMTATEVMVRQEAKWGKSPAAFPSARELNEQWERAMRPGINAYWGIIHK